MDGQNSAPGLPLLPDPFSPEQDQTEQPSPPFVLPIASAAASAEKLNLSRQQTQTFGVFSTVNNPQHPFISLSPTPSTPAQNAFNPDDFFASPPQPQHTPSLIQHTERFTPELKRRLFGPSDPLSSTPNTARRSPAKPYSLGFNTPIPRPSFTNPLSSSATEEVNNSLNISPTFSPSKLFADVDPPTQSLSRAESNPVQPPLNKVTIVSQTLPPQPGTPFTPLIQKAKCSCKASKCLKLYCPCFASSGFCGPDCTCKNCKNSLSTARAVREARETVLARDPRAFDPKVRNSPATASGGDIHSKGCNCRKGCAKNYCVCRELRVDCGPRCTCSGPNGCLNGKSDAIEDHQFRGKAEYILGGRSRFSPGRPRNGFLSKSARAKSFGGGLKRERKRLKKDPRDKATTDPSIDDAADVLSPSFPSLSFSPRVDLTSNIEEFRTVLAGGEDLVTPLSLRRNRKKKARSEIVEQTDEAMVSSCGERSGGEGTVLTSITLPEAAPQNDSMRPKSAQLSSFMASGAETYAAEESIDQRDVEMKEVLPEHTSDAKDKLDNGQVNNLATRTPERRKILGDLEAASSPTTDDKDGMPRLWSSQRGPLLGREEKIEICRLPRILRVKMGSGRLLRKFDL